MRIGSIGGENEIITQNSIDISLEERKANNYQDENSFSDEAIDNSIEELNNTIEALHKDLRFQIHEESGRMLVEIVNLENDEVIKEIPPKEVLDMLGRIKEMVGLLIDEKI